MISPLRPTVEVIMCGENTTEGTVENLSSRGGIYEQHHMLNLTSFEMPIANEVSAKICD